MSIKNLVEMIKHNGLLASMSELEELYQVAIQNEQKLAESDARCAALAAENAGLKAACERVSMWNEFPQATLRSTGEVVPYVVAYGSNGERDYMRNIATTALKETPATDAFLAEVRAQGVEMAACALDDVNQFNYANMLDDLAQKIRQEAAQ
ncbi:hypothetical protein ACXG85_004633 [Enterobacter kobei]